MKARGFFWAILLASLCGIAHALPGSITTEWVVTIARLPSSESGPLPFSIPRSIGDKWGTKLPVLSNLESKNLVATSTVDYYGVINSFELLLPSEKIDANQVKYITTVCALMSNKTHDYDGLDIYYNSYAYLVCGYDGSSEDLRVDFAKGYKVTDFLINKSVFYKTQNISHVASWVKQAWVGFYYQEDQMESKMFNLKISFNYTKNEESTFKIASLASNRYPFKYYCIDTGKFHDEPNKCSEKGNSTDTPSLSVPSRVNAILVKKQQ